jgi:hypothetical protein
LDIGINTSIKHGVLFIDNGGLDDEEDDDDDDTEIIVIHPEPGTKQ